MRGWEHVTKKPRVVVLLSGGLDSSTLLAIVKSEDFEPYALSFRYGQRHDSEIGATRRERCGGGLHEAGKFFLHSSCSIVVSV
jgi:7-cyano-7-deazaguanine synthase